MTSPIDPTLSSDQIAAIAEEAYVYAFPMMIAYGFFHRQTMGPDTPEKQAIGRFTHFRTLGSPTFNNVIPGSTPIRCTRPRGWICGASRWC
jgi:hypothetical protein